MAGLCRGNRQCQPLAQLFQEISTDDSAVGGGLTNVESKVKELLGQGVWDAAADKTTLPSVRLVVNKDELEGSYALAEIQICQVKGVSGENLSDKGISLYSFNAEELIEAQKQNGNLDHLREAWLLGQFLSQRSFLDAIRKSHVTTWNVTVSC